MQAAAPVKTSSAASGAGSSGSGMDTSLVVDVVAALLKENDVDEQEGYCRVKEQVKNKKMMMRHVLVLGRMV